MHWLSEHEFEQIQEMVKDREVCSAWGHKVLDTTEWMNNNNNKRLPKMHGSFEKRHQIIAEVQGEISYSSVKS